MTIFHRLNLRIVIYLVAALILVLSGFSTQTTNAQSGGTWESCYLTWFGMLLGPAECGSPPAGSECYPGCGGPLWNWCPTEYCWSVWVPSAPSCSSAGQPCTSSANSCGMTGSGTIDAASCTCNAATPSNTLCPQPSCADTGQLGTYPLCWTPTSCSSAPNACGQTSTGTTIDYWGTCSAGTPAAVDACPADPGLQCSASECTSCVWNQGASCTSSANACGATSSGTIQCNGSCSATPPAASDACPADPGLQCSASECGSCTPSAACAANTCSGNTCSDSCGNVYAGTKTDGICDAGGGATPSVSCSPSSQTVVSGGTASFTSSVADGAGSPYAWLDGSNNIIGSASTLARTFTSSGSVRVRASDGGGGYVYSGYCAVTVTGGACSNSGPVTITATPSRVQPGSNVTISWSGSNVGAASCTVTNLNTGATVGNSTVNSCSVSGSASISNLEAQTTYRLTCGSLTKDVTVNIVPNFSEF